MFDREDLDTTIEVYSYRQVRVLALVEIDAVARIAVVVVAAAAAAAETHSSMYVVELVVYVVVVVVVVAFAPEFAKLPKNL